MLRQTVIDENTIEIKIGVNRGPVDSFYILRFNDRITNSTLSKLNNEAIKEEVKEMIVSENNKSP